VIDLIMSFFNNNSYGILLIVSVIVIYLFRSVTGKLVEMFFTVKNLNVTLFIVFLLMVFLVSNTFYNFILICNNLVAPYMIALSALLASIVAMINMRKSYIARVLEESNEITLLTHNAIIKIDILLEKYDVYLEMIKGIKPLDKYLILNYGILFENIQSIIIEPKMSAYVIGKKTDIFYNMHNNMFFIISDYKNTLDLLEKKPEIHNTKLKLFPDKYFLQYDNLSQNLIKLKETIIKIKNEKIDSYNKLYKEEK